MACKYPVRILLSYFHGFRNSKAATSHSIEGNVRTLHLEWKIIKFHTNVFAEQEKLYYWLLREHQNGSNITVAQIIHNLQVWYPNMNVCE